MNTPPPLPRAHDVTLGIDAYTQADEEGLKADIATWNPKDDAKAKGDAYKTLFIGKISYDTNEQKLRREFEQYGPINSLRMVQDEDGKPRG